MAGSSDTFDRERYRNYVQERMGGLRKEVCVAIAARAAWRAMPLMFEDWPSEAKVNQWSRHFGDSIKAKFALAACYEKHNTRLNPKVVAFEAANTVSAAYIAAIYSSAGSSAAAVSSVDAITAAIDSPSSFAASSASSDSAAFAALAADAGRGSDPERLHFYLEATDADMRLASEARVELSEVPLWQESTSREWLLGWFSRAQRVMADALEPPMLQAWLAQWVRGKPPIEGMRAWLNDWWLKHPKNTERTPAFSDMPATLAAGPQPLSEASIEEKPEPARPKSRSRAGSDLWLSESGAPDDGPAKKRSPRKSPKKSSSKPPDAPPPPVETDSPPPKPPPEPEVIEKEVFINHLESTVAFVSDREAPQLTPTAEKCKEALARFLASRETQAPLTVSVEAPWGAGKTSFMSHLRKRMEAEMIPTVWFNPWKHEAGKTMWAAFAVAYERQMGAHLSGPGRLLRRVGLTLARLSWGERIMMVLRLMLWVAAAWVLWWLIQHGLTIGETKAGQDTPKTLELLIKGLPWVGGPVLVWRFAQDVASQFGSPLKLDMVQMFTENHHEDGVDDLHKFHEDFARLMRAYHPANSWWVRLQRWWDEVYAGMDEHWKEKWHTLRNLFLGRGDEPMPEPPRRYDLRRVVVFIDDLDRCEAPKAADVLQSLHLMLNVTETCVAEDAGPARMPDMICVLGMDREKVAAAVAAKHEKLLPLLLEADKQNGKVPRERAMGFGHEFLEKFIQLTLHLPGMMGEDRSHYLRGITGMRAKSKTGAEAPPPVTKMIAPPAVLVSAPPLEGAAPALEVVTSEPPSQGPLESQAAQEAADAAAKRAVEVRVKNVDRQLHDGETAYECALYAADALENNPRRLKQFVNLLRLRLLLAAALDLLDEDTLSADVATVKPGKLSVHHLAKLVALDLTCPQSMATMRDNPGTNLDGLKLLMTAEQSTRASVFTTLLAHGNGNCFNLSAAPLETYFQQLANVTPTVP